MGNPSLLDDIVKLKNSLLPHVQKSIQWPDPKPRLDLESRRDSKQRQFKHIHLMCQLHGENFRSASVVKHMYLLEGYLNMASVENPFGVYMFSRSMLEFKAFLHEVRQRLLHAVVLASRNWLDGRNFFNIIVRARFGTTHPLFKELLEKENVSGDNLKPYNITECLKNLSAEAGFTDVCERYALLCDYVHHNLGSGTMANAGSTTASVACSSGGGMLIMPDSGAITQYQYPVPSKAERAIEETAKGFLDDARACVGWINGLPETPYSKDQIETFIGTPLGITRRDQDLTPHEMIPRVGRNDPCFCGSGKKYKHCCLR